MAGVLIPLSIAVAAAGWLAWDHVRSELTRRDITIARLRAELADERLKVLTLSLPRRSCPVCTRQCDPGRRWCSDRCYTLANGVEG